MQFIKAVIVIKWKVNAFSLILAGRDGMRTAGVNAVSVCGKILREETKLFRRLYH